MSGSTLSANLEVSHFNVSIILPDKCDDSPGKHKGFLVQYAIMFMSAPSNLFRRVDKLHQILVLLTGRAPTWAIATSIYYV